MRAGRLVELGRVEFEEVPIDPAQPGELLVHSRFASICGSDLHGVQYGVELPPPPWPPGYPGHEGIGHVVESRADGFDEGDLVLAVPNAAIGRCMAEYQRLQAVTAVKIDPTLDLPLQHLLMAQQLGTVIFALRRYPTDVAGKTVVVLGQGSAGLFFCHLLKKAGAARVIVADLSQARLDVSPHFGADVTSNAAEQDVRAAMGRPGNLDSPAAVSSYARMAMGAPAMASNAGLSDGQAVAVVVDDPLPVHFTVGDADAAPGATIRTDGAGLFRLVARRGDWRDVPVQVDGDAELALQVLGAMAITP